MLEQLEQQLDSFDAAQRRAALDRLLEAVDKGQVKFAPVNTDHNLHAHTFFSYNSYGYSPSKFAWLARKKGLALAGTVDFDVLDALEEFTEACRLLNLKGCVGIETRVFVPEFATREINSPGEPGISYHMGLGFPTANLAGGDEQFLRGIKQTAGQRNVELLGRVNKFLAAVALDYEKDVLPLTPSGNATERHICSAYARKAQEVFPEADKLAKYWSEILQTPADKLEFPEGASLLNTIRAKTMKKGGVGYVQPGEGSFPKLAETNQFILNAGAIPTQTWLNGCSDGEQAIEELLDVGMSTGVAAVNIIPDRNFTSGVKDEKLANLYEFVEIANRRDLPIVVGTEMNSPGQKFVDDFDSAELQPLVPVFLKGAHIVYAHAALQRQCGLGYTSSWAASNFSSVAAKNEFFEKLGQKLTAAQHELLAQFDANALPGQILDALKS
ncbi:MAG: hypothetical protein JW936_04695 [Sedimentisphaerales bacterium]|nr:hypothetical protein [Sedimentisphaerales bacterium]